MTTDGYNTMDNASIMMVRSVQARYEQQKALSDRRLELLRRGIEPLNSAQYKVWEEDVLKELEDG